MKCRASLSCWLRSLRSSYPAIVLACAGSGTLQAADVSWNVAGPSPWTTGSNWAGGVAPTATDRAILLNGGVAAIADGDVIGINALRFINGSLTMTGGSLATSNTSDYMRIGDYPFNATVGTATLTMSGNSSISAASRIYFADGEGGATNVTTANVTLSDSASITNADQYLIVGRNHGTATVDLHGSSSLVKLGTANGIIIGDGTLANGTVTLHDAGATMTSAGEIWVGNGTGSVGNLNISAGTVTKANTGGSYITVARSNSTGTITVEGSGQLISNAKMRMAEGSSANGTIYAKDNAVVQSADSMNVGYQGTGKIDVSGNAQVTVGGELSVGTSSGKGTLLMTGGIFNANGTGNYVVGGGNNAQATVSLSGTSVINGGNMKWKSGDFGGTGNGGSAVFNLNDSSSLTLREFTIGHIGGATATDNVNVNNNATLTVNNFITIGRDDNTTNGSMTAHLNLNGGTLATKSIRAGGGNSDAANNNVVANGGKIKALADQSDFFQATTFNAGRPYVLLEAGGLTFDTNGFSVGVQNGFGGTGGLTKSGAGTLKLTGYHTFTGATIVSEGRLEVDSSCYLSGACTVNTGASLATSGLASGVISFQDLTFSDGSALDILNLDTLYAPVGVANNLTANGVVLVSVSGTLEVGDYPLIDHTAGGAIGGDGVSAFQLEPLGRGVVASIIDSSNVVTLHVSAVDPLIWKGNTSSDWDINSTANWTLSGLPETYQENDNLLFNDTATATSVVLNAVVNPYNVTFNNTSKDYSLSGTGSIAGSTGLTKNGGGMLTLANANTYTGATTVNGGTLRLGDGTSDGSLAGPLVVNDCDVVFNTTGTSVISGSLDGYSTSTGLTKIGAGTQVFTGSANNYYGALAINEGTVKFGNGSVNGAPGILTTYNIASGAALAFDYATAVNFSAASAAPWPNIIGSGLVSLDSEQPVNGSAAWGFMSLTPAFTGILQVRNGRIDCTDNSSMGGTSKVQLLDGCQLLARNSVDPYTTPIEIAGIGWGESGYNQGALRIAGGHTATWAGDVTLTADAGIMCQAGGNFTIAGSISGPYVCQFFSQNGGTLTLAPAAASPNSYGVTRINGDADGVVVAGNAYALSAGPLEVTSSTLKLNGNSFAFASLSGTGGRIGNYHASAPADLTIGGSGTTTYSGGILDGSTAKLGLVKNGTGTLALTGALTYTGDTTINAGVLSISSASLDDNATVTIAGGAVIDLPNAGSDTVGKLILGGNEVPGGTYGASHPIYGAYFTGAGTLVVEGGYDSWAEASGLTASNNGLTDDPDNDGTDNLLEFYLNGNPLASDPSILPAQALDATYLTLSFSRRDDAEEDVASQAVQYGSDLAGWTSVPIGAASSGPDANGVIVTVTENDADPDAISIQIPRALAPTGKLFGRLQVTK